MKVPTPTKLSNGDYRIQLRLNGKSIYVYGSTDAECRRTATRIKSEHLTGTVVQKKCTLTTAQMIDDYLADRSRLSPSTLRGYECIRDTVFTEARDQIVDTVKWQNVIDRDEHAPKTIKNAWGLISSAMRHAGIEPPKVTLPQQIRSERPFLDPQQVQTFIEAIRGERCEIAALLGLHSLRRSEILDLTWKDVDVKKGIINVSGAAVLDKDGNLVHKKENKNAASTRQVPIMIPRLKELLSEGGKGYIVTAYPNSIYKEVNAICEQHKLPLVGVHGLRHSFVSLAYHLGWSELATMKIAGYADHNTMREIYTHLSEMDKRKDINSMTLFFSGKRKQNRKQVVSKNKQM